MATATIDRLVETLSHHQLLEEEQVAQLPALQVKFPKSRDLAVELVRRGWLTPYQVNQLAQGKGDSLTLGPYLVLERLGEGGMGQVFKARQKTLHRVVALKVIRPECLDNPRAIQRFQREIHAAGKLSHPHIVHAYDADEIDDQYYIAMEFIDGIDLARLVKQCGPLPVLLACDYIRQAALGLQHAHECGLVHRDIKPANLLLAGGGRELPDTANHQGAHAPRAPGVVKILDLGLARWNEDSGRNTTHLTQMGTVMGTPDFIAPEQARNSRTSDIRGDIYSLGCTLYFLLAGCVPFPNGTLTEKLLQHQLDEPEPIEKVRRRQLTLHAKSTGQTRVSRSMLRVPTALAELVKKVMAKRPEERPQTPRELADALGGIQSQLVRPAQKHSPRSTDTPVPLPGVAATEIETAAPSTDRLIVTKPSLPKTTGLYRQRWKTAAAIGGVLFLGLLAAALGGKSAHPRAATDPNPVPDAAQERPEVKHFNELVDQVRSLKGDLDDTRLQLVRFRSQHLHLPQAKEVAGLLASLPSPWDDLQRHRLAKELWYDWQPRQVVGVLSQPGPIWKQRPIAAVAVSPEGRWLAAGGEDGMLRVWDAHVFGQPRQRVFAHFGKITRLAFAPDGRSLATAGWDGKAKIWDAKTLTLLFTLDKHRKPVMGLAYHPQSNLLASGGFDGAIRLWDSNTGEEKSTITGQEGKILSLAFAPDGKTLFWGNDAHALSWMDLADLTVGKTTRQASIKTETSWVRTLAISPDGRSMAVAGAFNGALHLAACSQSRVVIKQTLKDHAALVHDVVFSPDGKRFATGGDDMFIRVYQSAGGKPEHEWELRWPVLGVEFTPDGRHLVSANGNGTVYIYRLAPFDPP